MKAENTRDETKEGNEREGVKAPANEKAAQKPDTATKKGATKQESVYTAAELADACKTLGAAREAVIVALKLAGKEAATLREAKEIVHQFMNREVN